MLRGRVCWKTWLRRVMGLDAARVAAVRYEAGDRRCVVSLSAMNSGGMV